MAKVVVGENGVVVNVWGPYDGRPIEKHEWVVPDEQVVSVGDVFDIRDPQIDAVDVAVFRVLFRHENLLRQLIRSVRTNAGINTQANNNGLPTSANSPDLTLAQARDAFKALIP